MVEEKFTYDESKVTKAEKGGRRNRSFDAER
jgi:hypothetical protein